ncbi:MAG: FlgD immunoglobulin-like domain containing protein [Candidatus Krumholzibacteriia bacterium]
MTRISPVHLCTIILLVAFTAAMPVVATAGAPAAPLGDDPGAFKPEREPIPAGKALGQPVDFAAALAGGADYLRRAQADITEDNAGNGASDTDPDDGGWDWVLTDPAFTHSASASATNTYGVTGQGAYRAYLATGDPALLTVLTDAADAMAANPSIRSAADLIFLMNVNDLPEVSGTAYTDAARAKYDGRITYYGSATAFAEYIRDARAGQGYANGLIAWDVGPWVVAAQMLYDRYGSPYEADADAMAEVLWQDSFNDSPGHFDIVDDQGFDPTYADKNFWWYNLGICGLIDAFQAADVHTGEIPTLVAILLDGQTAEGAVTECYGGTLGDEDWQSTAYAVLSLAALDQPAHQAAINRMAYFLGATQHASGGWVYSSGNHNLEVGGECTAALSYGLAPASVLVDDGFTSQADVDSYNALNGTDLVLGYDAFGTIQEGIDAVVGSTVTVLPGTYVEQLHITTSGLQIVGAGIDQTIIQSPSALTAFFTTGTNSNYPVVFVDGATGVDISGVTIDGAGQGNANYRFQGLGFWNAGGSLRHAKVINIVDTPFSGAQHGVGIYAYNDTGGPYAIALEAVLVGDFQKNALALLGTGLTVDLDQVTTIGAGPTSVTAQNGIQISYGAGGTVDDCSIAGIAYTGASYTATGLLLAENTPVVVTNTTIDGCQTSAYFIDGDAVFTGGAVTNPLADALYAYSSGAKSAGEPRILPQPFDGDLHLATKAAIDVTVANSSFTGTGAADSWGVTGYGYGPLTFTVTGCTVTGWDWGVVTYDFGGASFAAEVHDSDLAANGSYGLYSNAVEVVSASCNWWGDVAGPNDAPANPSPGANVTGNVVYWPWLDAPGGACSQYGADNVAVVGPTTCLTPANPCAQATVVFNRTDTTPLRGLRVTFELSSELVLCTGNAYADIGVLSGTGTMLDGYTNYTYQIVDNGGGSYTVDVAVLGLPCGPTGGGGVFTVNLAQAAGVAGDATGTVTVTEVVARDCDNVPLPGLPGAPGAVTVDQTAPVAITDLGATQLRTGNDLDGTTRIALTWTAPVDPDADHVEIWRKGYGAYPEYDDGGGAPAGLPVEVGNGWTLVGTVPATSNGYTDEPATRDFWYYAARVFDACGNVSEIAAGDIAGGVLNYHLGDVSDGVTPGQGDNSVGTADISLLGGHYGTSDGDPGYLAYLDVGPTTDYSVHARPTTDDEIEFEDLIVFAINYGQVAKDGLPQIAPAAANAVTLDVGPATTGEGETFAVQVWLSGDGALQGLSVPLLWNQAAVEPVGFVAGDLIRNQGGLHLLLSPEPGTIDAALIGTRERGICGRDLLGTVTFQVKGPGQPEIRTGEIRGRDVRNQPVVVDGGTAASPPPAVLPGRTVLNRNVPNPFNPSTELSFVLARGGSARVRVYSMQGQLVRTLLDSDLPAGPHSVVWYGRDDAGRPAGSGTYIVQLEAPDRTLSQRIMLVK